MIDKFNFKINQRFIKFNVVQDNTLLQKFNFDYYK